MMKTQPALARVLAEQVYDNCLIAAGLLDDSRAMLPRLNDIMMCVVNGATGSDEPFQGGSTSAGKGEAAPSEPASTTEPEKTATAEKADGDAADEGTKEEAPAPKSEAP